MPASWILPLLYGLSALGITLGIHGLTYWDRACTGNRMVAGGILLAMITSLVHLWPLDGILLGVVIGAGALLGILAALRTPTTSVPEMVTLLSTFGAAATSSTAAILMLSRGSSLDPSCRFACNIALMAGASALGGALSVYIMIHRQKFPASADFPGRLAFAAILASGALAGSIILTFIGIPARLVPASVGGIFVLSAGFGAIASLKIARSDVPIIISLVSSLTGLAISLIGLALENPLLIYTGALGAGMGFTLSGTQAHSLGQNRFLMFFGRSDRRKVRESYAGIKTISAQELALIMEVARHVLLVPGYGLAISESQAAVKGLFQLLRSRGTRLSFGVHPEAGRMSGQMNLFLAEAGIPFECLIGPSGPDFESVDVSVALGANDIINPAATDDPLSPLYGRPVVDLRNIPRVIIVKRSLRCGHANVRNDLFEEDRTLMVLGEIQQVLEDCIQEIHEG